ncbi:MAG: helix-turn-helix domain-containing protein [Verrucomicrobia bacterium]|nr:helix-turn-helix domain-containing protein [Verrucomicrobiota bacterium]
MGRVTVTEKLLVDALLEIAELFRSQLGHLNYKKIISLLRKRLKMSQRTLAEKAKIPVSTLSRIETGKITPNLKTLGKIFQALSCDLVLLPLPQEDLDLLVKKQIRKVAEKRVKYVKGTMALELQQPNDAVIRELIAKEERRLSLSENIDIWKEHD